MMSEGKSCDGVFKKRNALGDVTNLVGKRGFSEISGGDVGDRKKVKSLKQVCLEVENLGKKEGLAEGSVDKEGGKEVLDCSRISPEVNELRNQFVSEVLEGLKNDFQDGRIDDVSQSVAHVSRDGCVASDVKPTSPRFMDSVDDGGNQAKDEGVGSQGEQSTTVYEEFDTDDGESDEDEVGDDYLGSSKSESIDCLRFPESQESRSGLERCVGLKGDGLSDSPVGMDLIKACSCSFCTKAAYIWSDLHYQDTKGRLAALKKSQKEANILVQRSTKNKAIDMSGQEKPDVLDLQSSLMGQWRSLFSHMEDIFGQESSQLESNLYTLKDLRDNCKTELESLNGMPFKKE
ncbi:Tether containing UBX domain for GLUT [Heracleum sosnowskyi]|uniref:Tether containing UBX domain for GLUT n=1 Tax=Heracleum sosnowskyi TaxID=360622 RepID=A0AAD8H5T6_9APIA|nr:Tether containing UBX domain for GLUT [Heracleum sosnowskyi]